jgi:hypothetical protein
MGEVAHTDVAVVSSSFSPPVKEEEERYVQVGSRFFRMKNTGGAMTRPHFLDACFLCKKSISRDRDIFMYRYAHRIELARPFFPTVPID